MTREEMSQQDIICNKCGQAKPRSEFYNSKMNRSGYRWQCKQCLTATGRERYTKSDAIRKAQFKYGKTDTARFSRLKSNAKKRGTDFNLDKLEFLIWFQGSEKICRYCGIALNTNGFRDELISFDRRDNNVGYTMDNIVLCCQQCNTIKGNVFTEWEMIEIGNKYLKTKVEVGSGQA